jgi:hypothetical protein
MSQEELDERRLGNFIENVRYYCDYNKKPMPDEAFIRQQWAQGVPLDDLVMAYEQLRGTSGKRVTPRTSKARGNGGDR